MKITIGPDEFNFLLKKVKSLKNGERIIKINEKISLQFRYCIVRLEGIFEEELKFPVLNPKTKDEDVISLVFDAKGLNDEYITEIEVFREKESYVMYIVPERDNKEIESFKKLLEA
jgi:hypothetical protein